MQKTDSFLLPRRDAADMGSVIDNSVIQKLPVNFPMLPCVLDVMHLENDVLSGNNRPILVHDLDGFDLNRVQRPEDQGKEG